MLVIKMKACPITLEMKLAASDKDQMVEQHHELKQPEKRARHQEELAKHKHELDEKSLPLLRHISTDERDGEEWVKFERPMLSF